MKDLVIGELLAASENGQGLLDFAPWWVKLLVGIGMVATSGVIHLVRQRNRKRAGNPRDYEGWGTAGAMQVLFGFFGVLAILVALGVF